MKRVLIDADVILDFFFDRRPFSEHATILFSLCEGKKIRGFITPVTYSNVYYLLRQTARHEKVIDKLALLLSITDVLAMDKKVVFQALNSGFKDFEDALQHYAAFQNKNIDTIITRNIKDYKLSEIGVLTPENFISTMGL